MIIPHSRPIVDKKDIEAVSEVLSSGKIAQGEKVGEFEEAVAHFVGVKHGVACTSGTSALHLALLSLGVGKGDEVIMPSYVCSSPFFATMYTGATPKLADINIMDFNISVESVKKEINANTKAIIVPHMFGTPADLEELLKLGVPVIEDCAQSLGAEYKNRKTGSYGLMSAFSFYATKMITTGEGGMVLTNEEEFYSRLAEQRDYDRRPLTPPKFNYKMTDFQAALGLSQLKKLQNFINRRRQIALSYTQRFSSHNVEVPRTFSNKKAVFYRYIIQVADLGRVQNAARKKGVVCERPVFRPLHKSLSLNGFPACDRADDRALSIPLYPSLSENEVEYVLRVLEGILS